ncbi:MAG: 30S ribosomal protein S20 [Deltaproteobacteria bacterium CG12_big_fil_rev_8_21_14_0_65_43_10]|nr:MAG: 30S ribosomal protein S20 [Deltaproteobacteria bacterium CG2_30_43_15]PIQ46651.1 MAG: 30S ribosomal protein S20 [Deltaproteobacteria bacterium CG12_big_fil_rev_8_21_14_0_65_43_10]PIU86375.1 MAG: 30S ribosomal protein S20 [Deltaproteobacteria bacterium CG06_land_8_20_14_3_00_44_19]PIX26128.1 MAG: 30S ribosomal protein S20 [Deltaproteobacteria bacterium CG_4_8_14_3_um_filter_43_13]PIZ20587.1 MAG: 30S ribosomal protein S20 [Deltaproteobacteria bacterium CG_4_10_14_0_8_um_filter_43_12]PJB3
MATHKSAIKQDKQSKKRKMRNTKIKSYVKTVIKRVRNAVDEKDMKSSTQALVKAIPAIDKAASKGVIHKKTASRKISRLTKRVNSVTSEAEV